MCVTTCARDSKSSQQLYLWLLPRLLRVGMLESAEYADRGVPFFFVAERDNGAGRPSC